MVLVAQDSGYREECLVSGGSRRIYNLYAIVVRGVQCRYFYYLRYTVTRQSRDLPLYFSNPEKTRKREEQEKRLNLAGRAVRLSGDYALACILPTLTTLSSNSSSRLFFILSCLPCVNLLCSCLSLSACPTCPATHQPLWRSHRLALRLPCPIHPPSTCLFSFSTLSIHPLHPSLSYQLLTLLHASFVSLPPSPPRLVPPPSALLPPPAQSHPLASTCLVWSPL